MCFNCMTCTCTCRLEQFVFLRTSQTISDVCIVLCLLCLMSYPYKAVIQSYLFSVLYSTKSVTPVMQALKPEYRFILILHAQFVNIEVKQNLTINRGHFWQVVTYIYNKFVNTQQQVYSMTEISSRIIYFTTLTNLPHIVVVPCSLFTCILLVRGAHYVGD